MKHVGFVTCSNLSQYFPSKENPLLTHDDYLAYQYLKKKGYKVSPHIWTESIENLKNKNYDILLVRSPWDYSESAENRQKFVAWLEALKDLDLKVVNPVDLMLWNLDKHYLADMAKVGCQVVPSNFVEPGKICDLLKVWDDLGSFVVKPCISAAARDTYRFLTKESIVGFQKTFNELSKNRSFMVQPYLSSVEESGEWSLIFLNGQYSHSLLKKPKKGNWLVQDELGGSVHWLEPPEEVVEAAERAFALIEKAYSLDPKREKLSGPVGYARVDIIVHGSQCYLSELEMIEPELFFLDRSKKPFKPHESALLALSEAICC